MIASSGETGRRVSGGYVTSLDGYDGQWEYMIDKSIRVTAFNPGFGGGTLANFRGELAGVVSLNLNEVGKFSLAIPIEYYRTYEQELKQYGQVRSRPRRPWLGIYPQVMAGHVVVGGVRANGPAAKFGLQSGDIILIRGKKRDPFPPGALPGNVEKAPGRTDLVQSIRVKISRRSRGYRRRPSRPLPHLVVAADLLNLALAGNLDRERWRISFRFVIDHRLVGGCQSRSFTFAPPFSILVLSSTPTTSSRTFPFRSI